MNKIWIFGSQRAETSAACITHLIRELNALWLLQFHAHQDPLFSTTSTCSSSSSHNSEKQASMSAEAPCYLQGIDVTTLSKTERRRLTRQAKKALKPQKAEGKQPVVKAKLTKADRKEKFTALAVKAREKQQKREQQRNGGQPAWDSSDSKNTDKLYCLSCRGKGHVVKDCKKARPNTTGMCFNCGSTEHALHNCKEKRDKSGALPYASCFVCNQKGHISAQCPQNEHGIYPKGGCCKICSSKQHLASQCPGRGGENDRMKDTAVTEAVSDTSAAAPLSAKPVTGKRTVFDDDDAERGDALSSKFDFETEQAAETEKPQTARKAKKAKVVQF
jgi:hypothetical protein